MTDCASTIQQAVEMLLRETFEGVAEGQPANYADSGPSGSLIGALSSAPAALARYAPAPGRRSIAQHARHARFHLEVVERYLRGDSGSSNWDESWAVDASSDTAWRHEVEALRAAYQAVQRTVATLDWQVPTLAAALGAIAHGAYHLGAIRQMLRDAGG